ncbi:hypothetical protein D3C72_2178170 [compost metagenome]
MADESGQRHQRQADGGDAGGQPFGQPDREPALGGVTQQGQRGGGLVAGAQHIGGAGVLGPVTAGVLQPHQLADHHGEGHGADQVGQQDKRSGERQRGFGNRHG